MNDAGARGATFSRRVLAALAVIVTAIAILVAAPPGTASAANAGDWDPGYIIDDAVFYDANSMSATEVQNFLNARVARCATGATCLKDYAQSTSSRPADAYCKGYTGSARETAAQIIDNVARSCGISQRVLIVLLEKEQSLVSSTAPSSWNYQAATGQGCPDTAACDPTTSGFFYQVYYAARQFKVYQAFPDSWGYRAQRTNNILYSPTVSCGTLSVFIRNQATAALYIYTPYTPNKASLDNLYGTGDSCSTYGNRNFWRIFTDWFGDPHKFQVLAGLADYWNANGGSGGTIGDPASYAVYVPQNGEGWYQRFRLATVYASNFGGTVRIPNGPILSEYDRQGGPAGSVSWPNGEQFCASALRCSQGFVGASMTSTPAYGGHVIWGGINDYWRNAGALSSPLGAAVNDMVYLQTSAGVAWVQNFEQGVLAQSASGFHVVPYSPLLDRWVAAGGAGGSVGWPTSDYTCSGSVCSQTFSGGVITADRTWGAHLISGGFLDDWRARGGLGSLGAAYNDVTAYSARGGGTMQNFASGILAQSPAGRFYLPYGASQRIWSAAGGEAGTYGWPLGERSCTSSGDCGQQFQGGWITESTAWGAHGTFGSISGYWAAAGGLGTYGPALNDIRFGAANGGGWVQHFRTGLITQTTTAQPVYTPYGPILDKWYFYGGEVTWLGWPTGPQTCTANSCVQTFQHGVARSAPDGSVSFSTS